MTQTTAQLIYTPEEKARMEIRNFVNEGLKAVEIMTFMVLMKFLTNLKVGIRVHLMHFIKNLTRVFKV